jgi:predicted porin
MDAGYQAFDYKGNKVSGIGGNGSSTSQINFRGSEDLGAGMKANFRVETDWSVVSNGFNQGGATGTTSPVAGTATSSFGNGELRVGVAGPFGAVDMGAINFHSLGGVFATANPYGTAIGSGYATILRANYNGAAVRSDNSVRYTTPSFNGLTANYLVAKKQNASSSTTFGNATNALGYYQFGGVQELGLSYANGPFAAAFSSLTFDRTGLGTNAAATPADNTKTKLNSLGLSYTMGAAKLGYIHQTNKGDTATSYDMVVDLISAQYTMGNIVLSAMTGSNNNKYAYTSTTAGSSTAAAKSKMFSFGADYNMSKTTALYFRNESITDDANLVGGYGAASFVTASGNTGAKRTRTAIGVRVGF